MEEKPIEKEEQEEEKFIPIGAVSFFIALIILTLIVWYGFYYIMIIRS